MDYMTLTMLWLAVIVKFDRVIFVIAIKSDTSGEKQLRISDIIKSRR